jgi:hypothetical protein
MELVPAEGGSVAPFGTVLGANRVEPSIFAADCAGNKRCSHIQTRSLSRQGNRAPAADTLNSSFAVPTRMLNTTG